MPVVTDAGLESGRPAKPANPRREYLKQIASRLRGAQSDDDAADALEAMIELSRTPDEE